jgi:hypothetical protein
MYYMLECFEPEDWNDSAGVRAPKKRIIPRGESWSMGRRFSVPPSEPIELEMMPEHNDQLVEFFKPSPPVMTKRLLNALHKSGVDNLDAYKTIIRHPITDFETRDYVAVNIIGLVSAVDIKQSNIIGGSEDGLLDVDFEGLKIDPKKARGLLLFRLVESTNAIVVHERVKNSLIDQGFNMLTFMDPKKWLG